MWVEKTLPTSGIYTIQSSSLWGCELKIFADAGSISPLSVILLVRMWVEKSRIWLMNITVVVILLVRMWVEKICAIAFGIIPQSHPPCEDVSWKVHLQHTSKTTTVILLVRMWVENKISGYLIDPTGSSSLWGCELKSQEPFLNCIFFWSSSLWGCELKKQSCMAVKLTHSHPPCEDVSWKSVIGLDKKKFRSHPPCEDVSWKTCEYYKYFLFWVILLVRMWVEKLWKRMLCWMS